MPSTISSRAPRIARAVARPPEGPTSRSAVPWITSVGAVMRRSSGVRLPDGDDRGELAARRRRGRGRGRSSRRSARAPGRGRAVARVSRSARRRAVMCAMKASRSRRRRAQERRVHAQRGLAAEQAAGVGHDRDQRAHRARVARGERLGDHAAHRGADHVRRRERRARAAAPRRPRPCRRASSAPRGASASAAARPSAARPLRWVEWPTSRLSKRTT